MAGQNGAMLPHGHSGQYNSGKRWRMNIVAICLNIFLPWFLFSAIFVILSFSFHYEHPVWAWFLVIIFSFTCIIVSIASAWSLGKKQGGQPMWYKFAAVAFVLATLLAMIFGDLNFYWNMSPYYDIDNLETYVAVDPSRNLGQAFMDAGKIYFTDGSRINTELSVGFKNQDIYCVAPIVKIEGAAQANTQNLNYDFWAIGKNCCNDRMDFRCAEVGNPRARNGLRLMRDEERPFFRLAVQEAEALYTIQAKHPLFFTWVQDPLAMQNAYRDDGFKYFLLAIFSHFAFNIFCVLVAVVGFSKMSRSSDR